MIAIFYKKNEMKASNRRYSWFNEKLDIIAWQQILQAIGGANSISWEGGGLMISKKMSSFFVYEQVKILINIKNKLFFLGLKSRIALNCKKRFLMVTLGIIQVRQLGDKK